MDGMAGMAEFGALIKRAREQRGLTGAELAARIHRPHSFLVRIEKAQNANPPDPQTFNDLALALGLSKRTMLEALGYLEPGDDAHEVVTVDAHDPRAALLAVLANESDEQVVRAIRIVSALVEHLPTGARVTDLIDKHIQHIDTA